MVVGLDSECGRMEVADGAARGQHAALLPQKDENRPRGYKVPAMDGRSLRWECGAKPAAGGLMPGNGRGAESFQRA